jgi:ubiquinone/menaquinone biosynthesis C-methylase UbiE
VKSDQAKSYPETIEHRWDILYREYPEVYERFASFPYSPPVISLVTDRFNLKGKEIVDNGCGTGRSAVALASQAKHVFGVEPQAGMRTLAQERIKELGVSNVTILEGSGESLPLPDDSADVFTSVTAGLQSFSEASRVLRRPGFIVLIDIAPGYYGGDLHSVLNHPTPELEIHSNRLINDLDFSYEDKETLQEYGTTENIIETYGFIFGRNAINYLRETGKTSIRWTFRLHFRELKE